MKQSWQRTDSMEDSSVPVGSYITQRGRFCISEGRKLMSTLPRMLHWTCATAAEFWRCWRVTCRYRGNIRPDESEVMVCRIQMWRVSRRQFSRDAFFGRSVWRTLVSFQWASRQTWASESTWGTVNKTVNERFIVRCCWLCCSQSSNRSIHDLHTHWFQSNTHSVKGITTHTCCKLKITIATLYIHKTFR